MVTTSGVTLSWFPYTPDAGAASVEISSYSIEMSLDNRKWTVVDSIAASTLPDSDGQYKYRVRNLVPGTRYWFRVVIIWLNANKPIRSIPGPPSRWIRTHCGQFIVSVSLFVLLLATLCDHMFMYVCGPIRSFYNCVLMFLMFYKKLSYRRGTARCVVSIKIFPLRRNSAETT